MDLLRCVVTALVMYPFRHRRESRGQRTSLLSTRMEGRRGIDFEAALPCPHLLTPSPGSPFST